MGTTAMPKHRSTVVAAEYPFELMQFGNEEGYDLRNWSERDSVIIYGEVAREFKEEIDDIGKFNKELLNQYWTKFVGQRKPGSVKIITRRKKKDEANITAN